jgi:hypothetical protein
MDQKIARLKKSLAKKAKRGFRGYPVGTLAYYGPDDRRASKLVAAIIEAESGEATEMQKWYSKHCDVRDTLEFIEEVGAFFDLYGVLSVTMPEGIVGCPREEDIDYQGPVFPKCPFWANHDRWTDPLTGVAIPVKKRPSRRTMSHMGAGTDID